MPNTILHMRIPRRSFLLSLVATSLRSDLWAHPLLEARGFSVQVGDPASIEDSHGDTWVPAWGGDGKMYSPSDDSFGFRRATDSNVAFNCFSRREPSDWRGETVNGMAEYGNSASEGVDGCSWKSSGCTFIDGALYLVVARHKYGESSGDARRRQTAANASIIRSTDFGRTWRRTARENLDSPMFPGHRFATAYFIQHGDSIQRRQTGRHVYAISNNGFWDNGDRMIVGRVRRDRIERLAAADWEFFGGKDRWGRATWVTDPTEARPVLESPGKLGMTGAVLVPVWRQYVMIGWYYPAGGGKIKGAASETVWDFYCAPEPWGPWTQFHSHRFTPEGYYAPQICPQFLTRNQTYVWTAGNWNEPKYYKLTLVPLTFHSCCGD